VIFVETRADYSPKTVEVRLTAKIKLKYLSSSGYFIVFNGGQSWASVQNRQIRFISNFKTET